MKLMNMVENPKKEMPRMRMVYSWFFMKRISWIIALMLSFSSLSAQTAKVRVTYYNLKGKTALGYETREGICAVSPDLEKKGFKLGEYVLVEGYGKFFICDRTNKKIKNTIDIWVKPKKRLKNGQNINAKLIYDND